MELMKVLTLMVALATVGVAAYDDAIGGCQKLCGDVPIPYPFGIGNSSTTGKSCFLEESFELRCTNSTLYLINAEIRNISLLGQMDLMFFVSKVCYNSNYGKEKRRGNTPFQQIPAFTISSKENKFVSVGCDTYGYLNSFYNGEAYTTGCTTICSNISDVNIIDGTCFGIGCCQVDIPFGVSNFSLQTRAFENFNETLGFNNCSYSFLAKNGKYVFSKSHLKNLPYQTFPEVDSEDGTYQTFPVAVDWHVGNETCRVSKGRPNYACKKNSICLDADPGSGYGYRCRCRKGYEGNPYHPDGCTDIDECKNSMHGCISEHHCRNINGGYECFCPRGQSGNGRKEGGCHRDNILTKVAIGAFSSLGSIILFLGLWWLHKVVRKRIAKNCKEKFFKKNGGLLLEQMLSSGEFNVEKAKHFSLKELEKATDNFNMNRVLGRGGQGTVYKGMLVNGKIIAVKKFKVQENAEEFINEFCILSHINHRNVVKLLGCCLEAEIPLLVYEFISSGTLFQYLHEQNEGLPMTWDTRLRIATEVAGALFYLHSAASQPIYHRDIKTTNILLDENYRAKVADFGTSRMVSTENTHLTTIVQGTFGYLDPEYFHTSQFTEKSDVYSFGVVLVELLTGQRPLSSTRPEEAKSLASYFILSMEENRLFDIIDERLKEEGEKKHVTTVANLAYRCLCLNGKKRPTMKEVAMELERNRRLESWKSTAEQNYEEIELVGIEDHPPWTAYSTSYTGSTQNSGTPSSSEVMPILSKKGYAYP